MKQTIVRLRPSELDAVIFDLDGVVTDTAGLHCQAWKQLFDEFLQRRSRPTAEPFRAFTHADYLKYVDGKPRYDGVGSFLASRGIHLPQGAPEDSPQLESVCGLGNRKNILFQEILARTGPELFPTTMDFILKLRQLRLKTGIISASENCEAILATTGIAHLFDTRVDGRDSARLGLKGKPAPDIFVEAANRLGATPSRTAVVEDALAGVEAGRRGGFVLVIGVDRAGQAADLLRHGAHQVVADLQYLHLETA